MTFCLGGVTYFITTLIASASFLALLLGCTVIRALRGCSNTEAVCRYRGGKWCRVGKYPGHRCLDLEKGEYR